MQFSIVLCVLESYIKYCIVFVTRSKMAPMDLIEFTHIHVVQKNSPIETNDKINILFCHISF